MQKCGKKQAKKSNYPDVVGVLVRALDVVVFVILFGAVVVLVTTNITHTRTSKPTPMSLPQLQRRPH